MFREFDYDNKPVTEIVDEIIDGAVNGGVSDIHFDPDPNGIRVRMRVDGDLHDYCYIPESVKRNLTTRVKIISGMNITEMRLPQDGAIKKMYGDQQVDMRVSSLPTIYGEKVVIRILDYSRSLAGLETLGFSEHNLQLIEGVIGAPNGIILLAGATGSGKSTTVYSILSRLNQPEKNIITVEDPVEMKMQGLNQVQVQSEIGLDFNATLRSILRQDPDTIMIGEIRDGETARIAVRASITGHLVLSTIHTNNSLNTVERLLDMDVERYLLGTSLNGIISQRLCKALCPKCKRKRPTTPYERNLFDKVIHKDVDELYEPVGCDDCYGGYKSRIAVHEVLVLNQDIRDAITNNMRKEDLRKLVYNGKDTLTLLEDGLEKARQGITSLEEILRIISLEDDFGEGDDDIKKAFVGKDLAETTAKKKDDKKNDDAKNEAKDEITKLKEEAKDISAINSGDILPAPVTHVETGDKKAEEKLPASPEELKKVAKDISTINNDTNIPAPIAPTVENKEVLPVKPEELKEVAKDIVTPTLDNKPMDNTNPLIDLPLAPSKIEATPVLDVINSNGTKVNPGMIMDAAMTPVANTNNTAPAINNTSNNIITPPVVTQSNDIIPAPGKPVKQGTDSIPPAGITDLPPSAVIEVL